MANPSPTISLCMIVRDEEKYLSQCLASVKEFVDEVVLVDTAAKTTRFQSHRILVPRSLNTPGPEISAQPEIILWIMPQETGSSC